MIEMAATAPSPTPPVMTPVMGELIDDMQAPVSTENSKSLKACVQSALTHYYENIDNKALNVMNPTKVNNMATANNKQEKIHGLTRH